MNKAPRKWQLTAQETNNLAFRQSVLEYTASAINQETGLFISEVRKRLNIEPDVKIILSPDSKQLIEEVEEKNSGKSNLILPNGFKK